jgi:hypothetical protein
MPNPQPLTVITEPGVSPRVYKGHTDAEGELLYVKTFHSVPVEHWVRFDHVDLYTDQGRSSSHRIWKFDGATWTHTKGYK